MKRSYEEQALADLVAMPTETSNRAANDAALDHLEGRFKEQGLYVTRLAHTQQLRGDETPQPYGALVATSQPTRTPKVMIYSHIDVTPASASQFRMRRDGDRLYGRGTCDMKFSAAASLIQAERLKGRQDKFDYGITIVTDEEKSGKSLLSVLDDGYIPQVALVCDATQDWDIEAGAKGAYTLEVTAKGKSAHGSRPWEGESASFRLLDALNEIRALFEVQGPDTNTLNISELRAGIAQNVLPDRAQASLDIRVLDETELHNAKKKVGAICTKYGLSKKVIGFFPPFQCDLDNHFAQSLRRIVEDVTGIVPSEVVSPGANDAIYYHQRGVPALATRPPCGGQHGKNEWLSLSGYLQFVTVLGHFIESEAKIG